MKTFILAIIAVLGITTSTFANKPEKLTLRHGQQKTAGVSKIKVKFVSVIEDSRCPAGANCVWEGNARISIKVTDSRGGSKILEVNTNIGPKGDQFDGYAINLISLTPQPGLNGKPAGRRYAATFSIQRLQR